MAQDPSSVAPTVSQEPSHSESQIFIRSCNRTCRLNVNLSSGTVETLKCLIEEREGIPVEDQYLILGEKPLRNGTLLRDYTIKDESTIHVFPRIRGGRRVERTLRRLVQERTLSKHIRMYGPVVSWEVLNATGERILRGIMSCFLEEHRANVSFNGTLGIDRLKVKVGVRGGGQRGETIILWETASVIKHNAYASQALDESTQKEDYRQLREVIHEVFRNRLDGPAYPLHVGCIIDTLDSLASGPSCSAFPDLARRTELLQVLAAMVDPVARASMWWNLVRFSSSLKKGADRKAFRNALGNAECPLEWGSSVISHPLFSKVYGHSPYPNDDATDLLHFARNWFTHVPEERWDDDGGEVFEGLTHLHYLFTHHFGDFLSKVLIQLYQVSHEEFKRLTQVLVPFS